MVTLVRQMDKVTVAVAAPEVEEARVQVEAAVPVPTRDLVHREPTGEALKETVPRLKVTVADRIPVRLMTGASGSGPAISLGVV